MKQETIHTPTPWAAEKCRSHSGKTFFTINGQGPMGLWIADINNDKLINGEPVDLNETDEANAKFIVRACNAHDELVAALENCVDVMVRAVGERLPVQIGSECEESDWIHDLKSARAALAKAKGER